MNEDAFSQFHQLYYPRLLRYLTVLSRGDIELSRDLLQTALSRVVRAIRPFQTETALWNWLAAIARNCFIDHVRKAGRAPAIIPLFEEETVDSSDTPHPPFDEESTLLGALDHCLQQLPHEERVLITAAYIEGHSQENLAERHGSTRKAVESKLARLRIKLRAALLRHLRHENT